MVTDNAAALTGRKGLVGLFFTQGDALGYVQLGLQPAVAANLYEVSPSKQGLTSQAIDFGILTNSEQI